MIFKIIVNALSCWSSGKNPNIKLDLWLSLLEDIVDNAMHYSTNKDAIWLTITPTQFKWQFIT